MFIDEEWKKQKQANASGDGDIQTNKSILSTQLIVIGVFLFIFFAIIGAYYLYMLNLDKEIAAVPLNNLSTSTKTVLPSGILATSTDVSDGIFPDNLRAEDLRFGVFYKAPQKFLGIKTEPIAYPINIKSDVINYYDISRKIEMKNKINELNANGFSMLDSQLDVQGSDFFTVYRKLIDNEVPLYVSSDFVWYYNQNNLKTAYKEIEKSVFFENMWDINKKFYDIALARYRKHLNQVGVINDPLLEGERLQATYWAVSLFLLKPTDGQISNKENFSDEKLFSKQESQQYSFDINPEIQREMNKEVKLIRGANGISRSPLFLYEKDYKAFKVPREYSSNAKLSNYYLAKKWQNTIFPLYYRNEECPNCLLDYNDWMNNFVAASLISEDFKNNQNLKNRWAAIYKFISFFEGLRSDLTYLHVNDAMEKEFPNGYSISDIFSNSNKNRKENLASLQKSLAAYQFLAVEGAINRVDEKTKPYLGMRILQENYWPNDYIFSKLTGRELTLAPSGNLEDKRNFCQYGKEGKVAYRCKGSGADLLNLLSILPSNNPEYKRITNYNNYGSKIADINGELRMFDNNTWNMNVYWINFDLSRNYIAYNQDLLKPLSLGTPWIEQKITNTVLGSWVNVGLSPDEWEKYQETRKNNLGFGASCDLRNFVEPNSFFYADLIERNNVLLKAVDILQVGKKTNTVSLAIGELNKKINDLKNISEKELAGENISEDDCRLLREFVTGNKVVQVGDKNMEWGSGENKVKESISGLKLIAYIYSLKKDERVMVVGPVYNYTEDMR